MPDLMVCNNTSSAPDTSLSLRSLCPVHAEPLDSSGAVGVGRPVDCSGGPEPDEARDGQLNPKLCPASIVGAGMLNTYFPCSSTRRDLVWVLQDVASQYLPQTGRSELCSSAGCR
ncbi:hypothetical protein AAG570_012084 [Ranatra chinensis]|uniref:Uncharacterized protein n=1 Tax=Ranatra chinensis TaxID=642074 RepID=A0ABD0Z029_9HEMI